MSTLKNIIKSYNLLHRCTHNTYLASVEVHLLKYMSYTLQFPHLSDIVNEFFCTLKFCLIVTIKFTAVIYLAVEVMEDYF